MFLVRDGALPAEGKFWPDRDDPLPRSQPFLVDDIGGDPATLLKKDEEDESARSDTNPKFPDQVFESSFEGASEVFWREGGEILRHSSRKPSTPSGGDKNSSELGMS